MADLKQQLQDKVQQLQDAVDAEQLQIAKLLENQDVIMKAKDKLIEDLNAQIEILSNRPSEEQILEVISSIGEVISDVESTIVEQTTSTTTTTSEAQEESSTTSSTTEVPEESSTTTTSTEAEESSTTTSSTDAIVEEGPDLTGPGF